MAEKNCIHCGANCMRSNLCQCGRRAFKEPDPDITVSKGHGTVIEPVIHKKLMCDAHKLYLVLSKQYPDYNVYRCTHTRTRRKHYLDSAVRCETSIRVYGDEL